MRGKASRELAELLMSRGAVLKGDFILSSGKRSSIYVDARLLIGSHEAFLQALKLLKLVLDSEGVTGRARSVIGIATGGIPWAVGLSLLLSLPAGYVRLESKGHGRGATVEGNPPRGYTVVVDDVATTGGSLERAVKVLLSSGYKPLAALVLVDRGEGASERLEKLGVRLLSVATLEDIVSYGRL